MTTTNDTTRQNFYIWTDDIYGEWSEPIIVDQGGIDPDLYFEDGKAFFMSNGTDDEGIGGIVQCEIDIETGNKKTPSRSAWQGSGGRYLESPHLYKMNGYYYLMVSEGGTEYGHMVTYARGDSPSGPFEPYAKNPVLTNRNLGGYELQGGWSWRPDSGRGRQLVDLPFGIPSEWAMAYLSSSGPGSIPYASYL